MRVLGLDPGLGTTGWGLIESRAGRLSHLGNGLCRGVGESLGARLLSLFEQVAAAVEAARPDAVAVEQTFVNRDGAGTLKLGQARGVVMLAAARTGLEVGEYMPNAIKKAVVGVGHADKVQVEHMVRVQLPGIEIAGPDASDALAIAICHAFHLQTAGRLGAALERAAAGGRR